MNGLVSARLRPSVYNGWKISLVRDRTPQLIGALLRIWVDSVKETHLFLSAEEIAAIARYVPQALQTVQELVIAETGPDAIAAFMGVENRRIEMLFVAPEARGRGIGKALIRFAVCTFGANEVTVNEQNTQAVGFYEHMGFKPYKRTPLDEQGNAYPLLYLRS